MAYYTAERVTVLNGSDLVHIVSGEPVAALREDDGLEVNQFNSFDILNAYTEDGTNRQMLQLVRPWTHADQVEQPAQVVPNAAHLNKAAAALLQAKTDIVARYSQLYAFETQASGTVTIQGLGINDADLVIRSIPQYKSDLDALEQQAQGSVNDVNAIDAQVNTPVTGLVDVVAGIDTTLQSYVSSASNSAGAANTDAGLAFSYKEAAELAKTQAETILDNFDDRYLGDKPSNPTVNNDGDDLSDGVFYLNTTTNKLRFYIGGSWIEPSATVLNAVADALQHRNDAESFMQAAEDFKNQAGQIVGGNFVLQETTINDLPLTSNINLNKSHIGLDKVDNTTDLEKQAAILLAATKDDVDLDKVDNTADLDKPISNLTLEAITALEDLSVLAFIETL